MKKGPDTLKHVNCDFVEKNLPGFYEETFPDFEQEMNIIGTFSEEFRQKAREEYEIALTEGRAFRERNRLRNRRKRLRKARGRG